ncbi:hypothetical protein ACC805_12265 [Rhizobium ruizarguesonis]
MQRAGLVGLLAASLWTVSMAYPLHAEEQPAKRPLCEIACKSMFQANDLGISFRIIIEMQRLGLDRPRWMYSSLQATADDLNLKFDMKELAETEASPIFDPVKELRRRIGERQDPLLAQSFALGDAVATLLLKTTALSNGRGELTGAKTESDFEPQWQAAVPDINATIAALIEDKISIQVGSGKSADAAAQLCSLMADLHSKWKVTAFDCTGLSERMSFMVRQASALQTTAPGPVAATRQDLNLDAVLGARDLVFRSNKRVVGSIDIWDFQDKRAVTPDDVVTGETAIAVRLGRDNDMAVIAAFQKGTTSICARYLYLPLRNGDDIVLKHLQNTDEAEVFSVGYGPYLGIAAVRHQDFSFLWDPSSDENPNNWNLVPPVAPLGVQTGSCTTPPP